MLGRERKKQLHEILKYLLDGNTDLTSGLVI